MAWSVYFLAIVFFKLAAKGLVVLICAIIGYIILIILHNYSIFFGNKKIKKLYNNLEWPIESYCAFFAEGFLIKADDMEGVFIGMILCA